MKQLITLIYSIILLLSTQVYGQIRLINEYSKKAGSYCSNSMYLYSENLYFRESGCEQRSYFSCGTYTKMNDSMCVLYETKINDFEYLLDVEFHLDSANTKGFRCIYKTLDDSLIDATLFNYTLEEALAWEKSDTVKLVHDYKKSFEERDPIKAAIPWNEKPRYRVNQKEPDDTIVLCLEKFQYLNYKRQIIIVKPNVRQVTISINLPYELLWKACFYNMKHSNYGEVKVELEPQVINLNHLFEQAK